MKRGTQFCKLKISSHHQIITPDFQKNRIESQRSRTDRIEAIDQYTGLRLSVNVIRAINNLGVGGGGSF